jgi:hypothetical protein
MAQRSLARLRGWLEGNGFAGIEPHDALTSPLLRRTPLGRSRFVRLAALQGLRRLPLNIRPLLGIRKRINPVSLGWALKAYTLMDDVAGIERSLADLKATEVRGYSGPCWGYYFDWQTRADFKPANLPIIVSTAFIGSGLLDVYDRYGREECLTWARRACDFIMNDLNRTPGRKGFSFSYTPLDHHEVYNASILGAALLGRVGAMTREGELVDLAREAIDFVVAGQEPDGSWRYGVGDFYTFIDNFHTGYVLMSLREYIRHTGDRMHIEALRWGELFYREHFFLHGQIPKYYHDRVYPIDAHAAAQSIVTLLDAGDVETAWGVAGWAIAEMQAPDGYFIYQIHRRFTNRIPYLRWSNAWMMYALARLCAIE